MTANYTDVEVELLRTVDHVIQNAPLFCRKSTDNCKVVYVYIYKTVICNTKDFRICQSCCRIFFSTLCPPPMYL